MGRTRQGDGRCSIAQVLAKRSEVLLVIEAAGEDKRIEFKFLKVNIAQIFNYTFTHSKNCLKLN